MVAAGLSWLEERDEVIDYTVHFIDSMTTLIARNSNSKVIHFWVYTDIFSNYLWFLIGIDLALVSCTLVALDIMGCEILPTDNFVGKLLMAISSTLGLLLQTPCSNVRTVSDSTKIAWITFSISLYVVFVHYTCNLTSMMTSDGDTMKHIKSYDDVNKHGYKVCTVDGTSHATILKRDKRQLDVEFLKQPPGSDYYSFMIESMDKLNIPLLYGSTLTLVEAGEFYPLDVKEAHSDRTSIQFQKGPPINDVCPQPGVS